MKALLDRIRNSEFLTFNEVLRLKLVIVMLFLTIIVALSYISAPFSMEQDNDFLILIVAFSMMYILTIVLILVNSNRVAMHFSIITILGITFSLANSTAYFYGYIMFFVSLTIIIFYHDILTYLIYGGLVTGYGVYYLWVNGSFLIGANSLSPDISQLTYVIILIGFFLVFLIQFVLSDTTYEKMNNEWLKMSKTLKGYQQHINLHLEDIRVKNKEEHIYHNYRFQQTVSELSIFINEFFEDDGSKIAEVVEYYFFLHDHDIQEILSSKEGSTLAKRYASQFDKYLLNKQSEMTFMLIDFATLFKKTPPFTEKRYNYNISSLFNNRVDELIALAFLYKYLRREKTQIDKYGFLKEKLSHEEITELFKSKEYREFLSFELVNFYLDNQELFENNL